eukprot:Hpha_TRINITY_DN22054_c0_g1::TRINITY_DN22054_c0_g1_i1::g.112124::m.112124
MSRVAVLFALLPAAQAWVFLSPPSSDPRQGQYITLEFTPGARGATPNSGDTLGFTLGACPAGPFLLTASGPEVDAARGTATFLFVLDAVSPDTYSLCYLPAQGSWDSSLAVKDSLEVFAADPSSLSTSGEWLAGIATAQQLTFQSTPADREAALLAQLEGAGLWARLKRCPSSGCPAPHAEAQACAEASPGDINLTWTGSVDTLIFDAELPVEAEGEYFACFRDGTVWGKVPAPTVSVGAPKPSHFKVRGSAEAAVRARDVAEVEFPAGEVAEGGRVMLVPVDAACSPGFEEPSASVTLVSGNPPSVTVTVASFSQNFSLCYAPPTDGAAWRRVPAPAGGILLTILPPLPSAMIVAPEPTFVGQQVTLSFSGPGLDATLDTVTITAGACPAPQAPGVDSAVFSQGVDGGTVLSALFTQSLNYAVCYLRSGADFPSLVTSGTSLLVEPPLPASYSTSRPPGTSESEPLVAGLKGNIEFKAGTSEHTLALGAGDDAKIVPADGSCGDARGSHSHSFNIDTMQVTVESSGCFRVCYSRGGASWTEVASADPEWIPGRCSSPAMLWVAPQVPHDFELVPAGARENQTLELTFSPSSDPNVSALAGIPTMTPARDRVRIFRPVSVPGNFAEALAICKGTAPEVDKIVECGRPRCGSVQSTVRGLRLPMGDYVVCYSLDEAVIGSNGQWVPATTQGGGYNLTVQTQTPTLLEVLPELSLPGGLSIREGMSAFLLVQGVGLGALDELWLYPPAADICSTPSDLSTCVCPLEDPSLGVQGGLRVDITRHIPGGTLPADTTVFRAADLVNKPLLPGLDQVVPYVVCFRSGSCPGSGACAPILVGSLGVGTPNPSRVATDPASPIRGGQPFYLDFVGDGLNAQDRVHIFKGWECPCTPRDALPQNVNPCEEVAVPGGFWEAAGVPAEKLAEGYSTRVQISGIPSGDYTVCYVVNPGAAWGQLGISSVQVGPSTAELEVALVVVGPHPETASLLPREPEARELVLITVRPNVAVGNLTAADELVFVDGASDCVARAPAPFLTHRFSLAADGNTVAAVVFMQAMDYILCYRNSDETYFSEMRTVTIPAHVPSSVGTIPPQSTKPSAGQTVQVAFQCTGCTRGTAGAKCDAANVPQVFLVADTSDCWNASVNVAWSNYTSALTPETQELKYDSGIEGYVGCGVATSGNTSTTKLKAVAAGKFKVCYRKTGDRFAEDPALGWVYVGDVEIFPENPSSWVVNPPQPLQRETNVRFTFTGTGLKVGDSAKAVKPGADCSVSGSGSSVVEGVINWADGTNARWDLSRPFSKPRLTNFPTDVKICYRRNGTSWAAVNGLLNILEAVPGETTVDPIPPRASGCSSATGATLTEAGCGPVSANQTIRFCFPQRAISLDAERDEVKFVRATSIPKWTAGDTSRCTEPGVTYKWGEAGGRPTGGGSSVLFPIDLSSNVNCKYRMAAVFTADSDPTPLDDQGNEVFYHVCYKLAGRTFSYVTSVRVWLPVPSSFTTPSVGSDYTYGAGEMVSMDFLGLQGDYRSSADFTPQDTVYLVEEGTTCTRSPREPRAPGFPIDLGSWEVTQWATRVTRPGRYWVCVARALDSVEQAEQLVWGGQRSVFEVTAANPMFFLLTPRRPTTTGSVEVSFKGVGLGVNDSVVFAPDGDCTSGTPLALSSSAVINMTAPSAGTPFRFCYRRSGGPGWNTSDPDGGCPTGGCANSSDWTEVRVAARPLVYLDFETTSSNGQGGVETPSLGLVEGPAIISGGTALTSTVSGRGRGFRIQGEPGSGVRFSIGLPVSQATLGMWALLPQASNPPKRTVLATIGSFTFGVGSDDRMFAGS